MAAEVKLDFENEMFLELLSEDGLLILAKGLGLDRIFMKFLKLHSDPHNLVLVIGSSTLYEDHFKDELLSQDHPPLSITNEVTSKEREGIYLKGGVLFITSRILVVDMLKKVCPIEQVAGILVYNAHRVADTSSEAFILRLFRESNKTGFIKGFSDCPENFTGSFCQLERVMKNLFVRQVYLWPRFHAVVSASLERHQPEVTELRQQMTDSMMTIQQSILDIMKACVRELKDTNPTLESEEMTVDNCLGKSFDQIIKIQFDPIWNQLSFKTKQLVYDLKMLKTLLYFLTQYDSVTFYSYLLSLRSNKKGSPAFSEHSPWIFMTAANTLFVKAKERVYGEASSKTSKYFDNNNESLLLEESPKWHLLSMVLDEVNTNRQQQPQQEETQGSNTILQGGGVLILANDERTCYQLRQYISEGGKRLLKKQFERLLAKKGVNTSALPSEMLKRLQSKEKTREGGKGPPAKKLKKTLKEEEEEEKEEEFEEDTISSSDVFLNFQFPNEGEEDEQASKPSLQKEGGAEVEPGYFEVLKNPLVIHALNSSKDSYHIAKVLNRYKPDVVIIYDADIKLTRQIEIYKATHPHIKLKVYFLVYDSSVEEQMYLDSIKKEKQIFQQLIQQKAHMVIPADRDGKGDDNTLLQRATPTTSTSQSNSTRKAGGASTKDSTPPVVLVDMREFRSSLPSLIHKRGIDIVPLTLEVGDYILTPDICVERKSISDLIGSLNSGRLYNQAKAMTKHYKKPILLIEFQEGKPFSLQSSPGDVSSHSVASKLVLLTIHFPKLRILWCPNPHFAAELFEELKVGHAQPDAAVASSIGENISDTTVQKFTYNTSIENFLLKLPGVNFKNCKFLMSKVHDMQDLVSKSEKELEDILGNDVNAKLLWDSLHTKTALVASSSTSSSSYSKNTKSTSAGKTSSKRKFK